METRNEEKMTSYLFPLFSIFFISGPHPSIFLSFLSNSCCEKYEQTLLLNMSEENARYLNFLK